MLTPRAESEFKKDIAEALQKDEFLPASLMVEGSLAAAAPGAARHEAASEHVEARSDV